MVETAQFARETIVTFGAGIAALLLVFVTIIYTLLKIPKFFKAWQDMVKSSDLERQTQLKAITELTATTIEVIRVNTTEKTDYNQSTINMTKSLDLLTAMFAQSRDILTAHDLRAQTIYLEVAKISERTSACRTRQGD